MLQLRKWYLDVVTDEGALLIAYAASLRWAGLGVRYASVLHAAPGRPLTERTARSRVALPSVEGDVLRWQHPGLQVSGEWTRASAPVHATLFEQAKGHVQWDCHMPGARVRAELRGEALTGLGYAECLELTCSPWLLPIETLRWGRHVSPQHALVWIGWEGPAPRQWVWLDGALQAHASIRADGLLGLDGGQELRIVPHREICDRNVLPVLARRIPRLSSMLAGSPGDLREAKRLGRSAVCRDGAACDEGWSVYEEVTW